ncbi:carbamoyltransferase family protein [Haloarchaeobius baliensis]|uniref:carbamoyltransferase family protein n=1 Tax=Haloarchaeobius baliensis TaxID=1670458 RepID=UPI003F881820
MATHTLSFKPNVDMYGGHDPSAALFEDGELAFAVEEERLSREKHAADSFPSRAIQACLDARELALGDVDRLLVPHVPDLRENIVTSHYLPDALTVPGALNKLVALEDLAKTLVKARYRPDAVIENHLRELGDEIPPIEHRSHHACHAASAFHPSGFDEALVVTVDAKGEYDSTVVWRGDRDGLTRLHTYEHPNSLGLFFAVVTEFLGYRMFNGEGKVMGLAPYGEENPDIERRLRDLVTTGVDYDVTPLTKRWGTGYGVRKLEAVFDRDRNDEPGEFDQWEMDLAYTAQKLLEETVVDIVEAYAEAIDVHDVGLAGGVALNCKLNKRVREHDAVEDVFVQPVANDAGLALGAGWLEQDHGDVPDQTTVSFGPSYDTREIRSLLDEAKVDYREPDDVERLVAERLADGDLVGWFQGRQEVGPRALGHRSILADPRTAESRDRVNEFVKHREGWRPFAPSILADAAEEYFVDAAASPFMIDTFDVEPGKRDEVAAVLHPADDTTRPQTVSVEQNLRYYRLIAEFESLTGVPALLNTSFNDHGEPIVTTPAEALKDFYAMGLDLLVLEDVVVEKTDADVGR